MRNFTLVVLLSLLCCVVPASAGVIFDNFTASSGTINGWTINSGYWVSDSFTLGGNAVVNGVDFEVWLPNAGASVSQVDWSIGTAPNGTDVGHNTALAITKSLSANLQGYQLALVTIALPNLDLTAGTTYYLTLQNAVSTSEDGVYWDESDGPKSVAAYESALGKLIDTGDGLGCGDQHAGTNPCSESFDILEPEPSTWTLLASGILAAFALRRRAIRS